MTRQLLVIAIVLGNVLGACAQERNRSNVSSVTPAECSLPAGQTRFASNGTTVCAPHASNIHVSGDCCDWFFGICYPPTAMDLACGALSTGDGGVDSGTDAAPDVAPDVIPDATPDVTPDVAPDTGATCALAPGLTRLASNGTTVCAPHSSTIHVTSDCCDWFFGICYRPSAMDLACGGSGGTIDAGVDGGVDAGTDAGSDGALDAGNDAGGGGKCALPAGQTRLASNGTTVCAPHSATIRISSDCCDWFFGVCYRPSAFDLACGGSGGVLDAGTDAGSDVAVDTGVDAQPDVVLDTGVDAQPDAAMDTGVDAQPDVAMDSAIDAVADVAMDSRIDAGGNSTCATALPVQSGTELVGETTVSGGQAVNRCVIGFGPNNFYSIVVPPGYVLEARAEGSVATPGRFAVQLLPGCAGFQCFTWAPSASTGPGLGESAAAFFVNEGPDTHSIVIAVGQLDPTLLTFDLRVTLTPIPPNAICTNAIAEPNGTTFIADPLYGDYGPSTCISDGHARTLYYSVTVGPNERLTVVDTTLNGVNPVTLSIIDGCDGACLSAEYGGRLVWTNTSASPKTVVLAVGDLDRLSDDNISRSNPLAISIAIAPPGANAVCASAIAVTDGTHLTNQSTALGRDTSPCLPNSNDWVSGDTVLYYSSSVSAGYVLTVAAVSTGFEPPFVAFAASCGGACLPITTGSIGNTTSSSYVNTGASTVDVVIVVAGPTRLTSTPFDLNVRISPQSYTQTLVPTACDDMTGASLLPNTEPGGSEISPPQPLPFAFGFMGSTMAGFAAYQEGFVQLSTQTSFVPSPSFTNAPIPNPFAPNAIVAPYWAIMVPEGVNAGVFVKTFGDAPNRHLTLLWRDFFSPYQGALLHMTYQAKLFETTNVIEFHYCSIITAGGACNADGSQCGPGPFVIGAEDSAGMRGFNYDGAPSTTDAVRLTPR